MNFSKKTLPILLCTVMILGVAAIDGEGFIETLDLLSVKASAEESGIYTYEISDDEATVTCCTGRVQRRLSKTYNHLPYFHK